MSGVIVSVITPGPNVSVPSTIPFSQGSPTPGPPTLSGTGSTLSSVSGVSGPTRLSNSTFNSNSSASVTAAIVTSGGMVNGTSVAAGAVAGSAGLPPWAIAVIVVLLVAAAVVAIIIICCCCCRRAGRDARKATERRSDLRYSDAAGHRGETDPGYYNNNAYQPVVTPALVGSEEGMNSFRKPLKVVVNTQSSVKGHHSLVYRQPYNHNSQDNAFNDGPTAISNYQVVSEEELMTFPSTGPAATVANEDGYMFNRL